MLFSSKIPAYLIDSENVGSTWVNLLQTDEKFELFICVTENAKSLNFSLLKELTNDRKFKINIIECEPGKNSLDFYLSSFLGYLIGKDRHSSYIVVSQDTGYDHVIEYWQKEGYDVKRINTKPETKPARTRTSRTKSKEKPKANQDSETRVILKDTSKQNAAAAKPRPVQQEQPAKKETTKKQTARKQKAPQTDETRAMLKELLKDHPDEIDQVKAYLDKVPAEKRSEKQYIYRGLTRKFKSEKGLAIYTAIKKDIDKYYQLSSK